MGGKGTFAVGKNVPYSYKTVDKIDGVKVLQGLGILHNLPEEAHSSKAYLKVDSQGNFVRYREYNADRTSRFDIDYHKEPKITGNKTEKVFHIHFYDKNGVRDVVGRRLTLAEFEKYKRFFRGRLL